MPFLIIFIIVPIMEIYAFIKVGGEIGAPKTILLCVLTAIIGGLIVRMQGIGTLIKAQNNIRSGKMPLKEIFDGFCIVVAGALLVTPGFVTDITGFLLLFPPFRSILCQKAVLSGKFETFHAQKSGNQADDEKIIEGEYETVAKEHEKLDKSNKNI